MPESREPLFRQDETAREPTLRDVWATLAAGRNTIILTTGVCLAAGFLWLLWATPLYTASLRVASAAPAAESQALGQLAALLPGRQAEQAADPFAEYRVLLHSERLAAHLNEVHRLDRRVFPYDAANGRFYEPGGPVAWGRAALRWLVGLPGWSAPDDAALADYLRARVRVAASADVRGIYAIEFAHPDRDFARDVLGWVHEGADAVLSDAHRQRAERYVAFLARELQAEQNVETRAAMRALLLDQSRRRMMAAADVGYGARIVDGPSVSPRPTSPSLGRVLLVVLATGVGLGIVIVFTRGMVRAP
ncbi:MAG: Wzz/FepE/Etk N-terminal domain-containing protein [Alphaproteobacteria bacterium]